MSATAKKLDTENYRLTVIPQQPRIGAEIYGLDLSAPLTNELYKELKSLLRQYKVFFFATRIYLVSSISRSAVGSGTSTCTPSCKRTSL